MRRHTKGQKEFDEMRRYNAMGRLKLDSIGKVEDIADSISKVVRDEKIIEGCLEENAILLTVDKSMSALTVRKNAFTIFI